MQEERAHDDEEAGQRAHRQVDPPDQQRDGLSHGDEAESGDEEHHGGDVERQEVPVVHRVDVGRQADHDRGEDGHRGVVALELAPDRRAARGAGLPLLVLLLERGGRHRGADHPLLGDLVAAEGGDHMAPGHDDHPVAEPLELLGVRRRDDHRHAGVGDLAQDPVDLRPRADVDTLGRLVGQEDGRLRQQRAGHHDLLLVAAGERRDRGLHRRGLDVEGPQLRADDLDLATAADEPAHAEAVERGDGRVLAHRHRHHQALVMAIGGHVGGGVVQAPHGEVLVADPDLPVEAGEAGEGAQQLAPGRCPRHRRPRRSRRGTR